MSKENVGPRTSSFSVNPWLQLFRVPNLLTVPGDPLAGYMIAAGGVLSEKAWVAAAASLCFYCGGLLTNDLADIEIDRRERPGRPLPSGRVNKRTVQVVAVALFLVGLLICGLLGGRVIEVGVALAAAILAYNFKFKRISLLGPLTMGCCRGLSLALGSSAVPWNGTLIGIPFLQLALYVAAVTELARNETETKLPGIKRWAPARVLTACLFFDLWMFGHQLSHEPLGRTIFLLSVAFAPLILAILVACVAGVKLGRLGGNAPGAIGLLISNLIFIQAFFMGCATPDVTFFYLLAGGAWVLNRVLARWFYAS